MRIAVVGCGAIADGFHLPALRRTGGKGVEVTLVDPDPARRSQLASRHGATLQAASHQEILDRVDGAVIATPHFTHVPIALDFVRAGIPVLVEKPLGTSAAEVRALHALSEERGVSVAVNQTRRFIPACEEIRRQVAGGALGRISRVEAAEGDRFGWPAATPSMFGARSGGRGVLLDIGAHALDLIHWWLDTHLSVVEHLDDSFGGSEGSCTTRLDAEGVPVQLRLSWLARQSNRYRIEGTEATLEWEVHELDRVVLRARGGGARIVRVPGAPPTYEALGDRVMANFISVVEGGEAPAVAPAHVLPAISLIEACYAARKPYALPWQNFVPEGGV